MQNNLAIPSDTATRPGVVAVAIRHWKRLCIAAIFGAVAGGFLVTVLPPKYVARTVLIPPQQQGGSAAAMAALGSLGALAGLTGGGMKSTVDQYVALMKSVTLADRIIDRFDLQKVYDDEYRSETRRKLDKNVQIAAGKKDGLITVEVEDKDPKRAADIANAFVDGLRQMSNSLAISEAQQRRVFFEGRLKEARDALAQAQLALQQGGYNPGALKSEPKAAADRYVRLQAEIVAAEVRLQHMRQVMADGAIEVAQQQAALGALRAELAALDRDAAASPSGNGSTAGSDYVSRYREFKYQETLYELFAKQYESARVDESREGALVQVVDAATPPDKKSRPKPEIIIPAAVLAAIFVNLFYLMGCRER